VKDKVLKEIPPNIPEKRGQDGRGENKLPVSHRCEKIIEKKKHNKG
jgi:hypothetical protein